jgi:hypothetical protein
MQAVVGRDERWSIVDHVAANPKAGDLIVGSEINALREELSHLARD